MTSRASRFSPFADRVAAALAAAAVFLVAWGLVHTWFWAHGQIVDWPTYLAVRPLDAGRPRPVPRLRGRVSARCAARLRPADLAARRLRIVVRLADGAVRRAARRGRRVAAAGGGVLRRARAAARRLVDPLALRPLAGAARHRVARAARARRGISPAGRCSARPSRPSCGRSCWCRSRSSGRSAAGGRSRRSPGAAVLLAVTLPFAIVSPGGLWDSISGQASRPLQVESLGAAILTTFSHPAIVTSHGSQNIVGHHALASAFGVAAAARAGGALGRVRARPCDGRPAAALRRRVHLCVHRLRQGALAAVPDLAAAARAARPRPPRPRRDCAPDRWR